LYRGFSESYEVLIMRRKGFTLIELITAVGVLAIIFALAAVVISQSAGAQRQAMANAEITQKFSAITSQLRRDFSGLIRTAPGRIEWSQGTYNYDSIIFFATGDFQSHRTYPIGSPDKVARGNTALIHYCIGDLNSDSSEPEDQVLLRRQIILTKHEDLQSEFDIPLNSVNTDQEVLYSSLSELMSDVDLTLQHIESFGRLPFDYDQERHIANLLADGVYDFRIEILSRDTTYQFNEWLDGGDISGNDDFGNLDPTAIKFTFWITDSRGIIETYDSVNDRLRPGRPFTYIVPIAK